MRINRLIVSVAVLALAASGTTAPASGQLANASAATLGLGQNNTATVRGFGAVSVNPAGLGMPGSGFSIAPLSIRVRSGLDPISLADLAGVEGTLLSASVREDWLSRVGTEGSQAGAAGARISLMAVSAGRIGFQVSTIASAHIDLAPSIVEAILFGNAGRTGQPADLTLSGSSATAFAITTAGASFAVPIPSATGSMSLGVTGKYLVGHGVAVAQDQGGLIQSDPLRVDVDFPMIVPREDGDAADGGTGIGLDVGFMMEREGVSFGIAVQNIVNTFEWNEAQLAYRAGVATVSQGTASSDFDEQPLSGAPAALRSRIAEMTFEPALSVGAGLDVSEDLTVSADLRNRFGDGIDIGPNFHLGAGAEYRGLKVLHLRGGAAIITDGIQLAGGASLVLGPLNFSAAAAVRRGDLEDTALGQFTVSFGGR